MTTYKKQLKDKNGNIIYPDVGIDLGNVVYSDDPTTPIGDIIDPYTYSTTETRVGTWIDGKPIYRRVFSGTASSANMTLTIGTGVVDQFTSAIGYRTTGSGPYDTIIAFYNSSSDYFRCWGRKTAAGVASVELRNGASGYKYFAIVEYTKLSD